MAVIKITDYKPFPPVIQITNGLQSTTFKTINYSETFYSKVVAIPKSC